MASFRSLGLNEKVLRGVKEAGFTTPSPIQEKAIPPILERRDVIAQAQTGTGKTAAFALPILNTLKNNSSIEALIITPTRELAMQISDEIFKLGKFLKTRTICVYGGQSIRKQMELIEKKPQVMVATPGRLLDHLTNGRLKNFTPSVVVLDESDEMLDMGFIDDIEEIFEYIPNNAQILLFSATMPPRIKELADKILYDSVYVKITSSNIANTDISQRYYIINENERNDAIIRLIDTESPSKSIIFIRTKKEADELNNFLQNKSYKSVALHGDMDQRMRRESIKGFKENKADIMVATDVAARGLDISDISHVFNYHIPLNIESYVHRIGRTGRAGKKGVAITLATPLEYKDLKKIQSETNSKLELYEIPSVGNDEMITHIFNTKVSDEAINFYENIKDKIDSAQLILRLLSIHLKQNARIGLSKQEAHGVQLENDKVKKDKKTKHSKASDFGHTKKIKKQDLARERAKRQKLQSGQKYYKD
ncbi:DEAD/DEAH box helicase [Helicobacter didelphidarum]|nr:DEAD/DEAH box helicase [Helicobacter didelphidarum]